jgi:hypothetical protein
MTAKVTRTRYHRRDRRRAKVTGYARQGKIGMGSRVGHGTYGKGRPNSVSKRGLGSVKYSKRKLSRILSSEKPRQEPSKLTNLGSVLKDSIFDRLKDPEK